MTATRVPVRSLRLGFTVSRTGNREYHHLTISVLDLDRFDNDALCEFTWQGDTRGENSGWYAFRIKAESQIASRFRLGADVAYRLVPETAWDTAPDQILAALKKRKATQVVYDSRQHKNVPVDAILPPTISRWMDDYRQLGTAHVQCDCLVETAAEAKANIAAQLSTSDDSNALARFESAGRPVFTSSTESPPTVVPLAELLRPPLAV